MKLKPYLGAQKEINVGSPCLIESDAIDQTYGVVFEDEGETGYFYARDYVVKDELFVDALHIYTVKHVVNTNISSSVRIIWSNDWSKAALLINDLPHAMFDFIQKVGYSIDQFPEPDPNLGWRRAPWSNSLKSFFYEK